MKDTQLQNHKQIQQSIQILKKHFKLKRVIITQLWNLRTHKKTEKGRYVHIMLYMSINISVLMVWTTVIIIYYV